LDVDVGWVADDRVVRLAQNPAQSNRVFGLEKVIERIIVKSALHAARLGTKRWTMQQ
jgi:hypothetical protein